MFEAADVVTAAGLRAGGDVDAADRRLVAISWTRERLSLIQLQERQPRL